MFTRHLSLLLACAIVLAAGAVPALAQTSENIPLTAQKEYEEGRTAFFKGETEKAIGHLAEAVNKDQEKAEYRFLYSKALLAANRLTDADKALEALVQKFPDHVDGSLALARRLSVREEWKKSRKILDHLVTLKRTHEAFSLLGEAAFRLDDLTAARAATRSAIGLNDTFRTDHHRLGAIELREGRFALARDALLRAVDLGNDDALAHFQLSTALINLRAYLGRLVRVEAKSGKPGVVVDAKHVLVDPVRGKEDWFFAATQGSALFHAMRARDLGLDTKELKLLVANIWFGAKRWDRAFEAFNGVMGEIEKDDRAVALLSRAEAAMHLDKFEECLRDVDEAVKIAPERHASLMPSFHARIAERYRALGKAEEQIKHLRLAIDASPTNAEFHYQLGQALWDLDRKTDAATHWSLTLDLNPSHLHAERIRKAIADLENSKK